MIKKQIDWDATHTEMMAEKYGLRKVDGANNIREVEEVVGKHFPEMMEATKVALSVCATLLLEDNVDPVGVNFEGNPSSTKTTVLGFLKDSPVTFQTDYMTPKSFVSHYANRPEDDLEKIDLLPKIRHKTIIVPELAPIFGSRKEDLMQNMSVLTRVFDGEGLETDSGVRGHRGYSGDYLFAWLGATTPLSHNVWKVMGKLGVRFLFYSIPKKNKGQNELLEVMDSKSRSFKIKINRCRKTVSSFLTNTFCRYGGPRQINWDSDRDDPELKRQIIDSVELMRRLRAPLQIWVERDQDGNQAYSYTTPIMEEPERAITQLYHLARGHALIHGRDYLTQIDINIVKKIARSSMPYDRRQLLEALLKHNGEISTETLTAELNSSDRTARRTIEVLQILGIVDDISHNVEQDGSGRPMKKIRLKDSFSWLIESTPHTVKLVSEIDNGHENDGVGNENLCSLCRLSKPSIKQPSGLWTCMECITERVE